MEFLGDGGAADRLAPFDHPNLQPGHGEIGRACQAVVSGADDDRVKLRHGCCFSILVWSGS
jgi:hypothetical protein